MQACNFLLAGVGGQGTILASDVLAEVALAAGLDVKKSEVHGMAQRGGSVNTHVRWNAGQVHSPLIGEGEADILLAFEEAEALRYARYLRRGGVVVVNRQAIKPITVTSGGAHYPSEEELRAVYDRITDRFHLVPGAELAEKLGNARAANVVLLGVLSSFFDLPAETWLAVIEKRVPPRYVELNRQAFFAGREVLGNTQS
ncbi:MAG: indolepyruvate oxidoreductase subunit beta [Anaerolineaceae bacterium]|jgi:indolepyruvate ferredoxin oxidoreductase beta subunit|nr:indolepyruvate oxidoreductase subunit beta [Anaerolineae bacterium]MDX9828624.1 indolepyruvate oxidoreductase subunit beta [Anaerolineae bacterium]NLF12391.1 indolepyruvate oxidoreductase subunit beta [Anaerolineaceae bacterium]